MSQEQYNFLDELGLGKVIDNIKTMFAKLSHSHKLSDISDYTIDSAMSSTSMNPVQNKVINSALSGKVPTSRTINGKKLSSNITLSASDVGAATSSDVSSAKNEVQTNLDTEVQARQNADAGLQGQIDGVKATADKAAEDIAAINNAETGILAQAKEVVFGKKSTFPANGSEDTLYVDTSVTESLSAYRWNGTSYVGWNADTVDPMEATEEGVPADALKTKEYLTKLNKTTTNIDFSNWDNGSFQETLSDGTTVDYAVTFDSDGKPTKINDCTITW